MLHAGATRMAYKIMKDLTTGGSLFRKRAEVDFQEIHESAQPLAVVQNVFASISGFYAPWLALRYMCRQAALQLAGLHCGSGG